MSDRRHGDPVTARHDASNYEGSQGDQQAPGSGCPPTAGGTELRGLPAASLAVSKVEGGCRDTLAPGFTLGQPCLAGLVPGLLPGIPHRSNSRFRSCLPLSHTPGDQATPAGSFLSLQIPAPTSIKRIISAILVTEVVPLPPGPVHPAPCRCADSSPAQLSPLPSQGHCHLPPSLP